MKQLIEKSAAAMALIAILGLGYALNQAPAEWSTPLYLGLPVAVTLLALKTDRIPTLIGTSLAILPLWPHSLQAWQAGHSAGVVSSLVTGLLCLTAGFISPNVIERRRIRAQVSRRLCDSSPDKEPVEALLEEALLVARAEMGEVLLIGNGNERLQQLAARGFEGKSETTLAAHVQEGRRVAAWAARKGRPCNYRLAPESSAAGRTVAALPLRGDNGVVGVLCIYSPLGQPFQRRDLSRLKAVAKEGATTLQPGDLSSVGIPSVEERAEQLAVLEEIARTINASLDLSTTLKAILTSTRRLIDFDLSEVALWDPDRRCLVSRASLDADAYQSESGGTYRLEEGYTGWLARNREPLLIPDISRRQDVRPKVDRPGSPLRSYLGIPLGSRGEFVGTLELASYQTEAFGERDLEMLQMIGLHAATAIEHARLYEEARHRALELTSLARVSAAVSSTLDLDRVLHTIAASVLEVVGCHQSAIFVLEEDQQLHLVATYGMSNARPVEPEALPVRAGGRAHAAATGQPLIVENLNADPGLEQLIPLTTEKAVGAFGAIPLRAGERVIGMLTALFVQPRRFTAVERDLLTSFADQAAIAIENAQLYARADQELQNRTEALSSLQRVARELSVSLDREVILKLVVEETLRLSEATHCALLIRASNSQAWSPGLYTGFTEDQVTALCQWLNTLPEESVVGGMDRLPPPDLLTQSEGDHETTGLRSTLIRPMWYGERVAGAIVLGSDAPRVFNEKTGQLIDTIGAQAAVAIENVRLLEALRGRLETLSLLNELTRSVTAKLDLEEVLHTIVDAASRLANCQRSVVFLLDRETGRYVPRAVHGDDPSLLDSYAFAPGEALVGTVAENRASLSIADVQQEGAGDEDYLNEGAAILVPMVIGEQVVGVLAADRPYRGGFQPADEATLTALADQVAVAAQNARLFDEAVRRTDELSTLLEASGTISSTLDLNWVLQALGSRLLDITNAESCLISEWDQERQEIRVAWEAGTTSEDSLLGTVYPALEQPHLRDPLLTHQSLLIQAGDDQIGESAHAFLRERQAQSMLLTPMVARGQTVGLVELERRQERRPFTPGEIRLAEALASQAAAALQNARLYDEVRRFSAELEQRVKERTQELGQALEELTSERDRMEALYRIAAEVSASLDLDRALNRALELVVEATKARQGLIFQVDPETDDLIYRAAIGVPIHIPPGGKRDSLPRGESLTGWLVEQGEITVIDDLRQDSRWSAECEEDPMRRTCLAAPLGTGGDVYGALILFSDTPGAFTEDHARVAEAGAAQTANAVSNAALYNLLREQAERLGSLLKQQQVESAKSQAILEGVADGVMVADAQGQIILFNAAAERVLEIPREEALGRSTKEMLGLYGMEGQAWLSAIEDWAVNPADRTPEDFVAERLELDSRVISAHISPVIMRSEYLGTVSVFRDVTAEVEADRAKSEFVSTVSHELRTPMTSIKGYVDLLLMGSVGELSEQQEHFLSIIRNNANRLTELVNDLLDISRIETGRMEPDLRAIHLHGAVMDVINTLAGRAQGRSVALQTDISPELPPVTADGAWLTQILTNLIGNAVQYTPPGGKVTISARRNRNHLEISVADTGIGISRENQNKIFDRFFRADDPLVQETSGTGLGLPITKSLVHMLGGEIWVDSEPGEGSTFTFTLSMAESETSESLLARQPKGAPVLVVEDDEDVANLIRIHLEAEGYEVVTASRGDEALKIMQDLLPVLVTLDIRLPDTDGFVLLERMKKNPTISDIPVVVVSVIPDKEKGLRLGALDYVGKPIDEKALLEAVRKVLHQRGLVLVVDDDRDNLSLMREALRRHGFRVRTTARGQRALRVAREAKPALILLDLRLGDMDGDEVLKKLKSDPRTSDIPVILMTGSLTHEELKQQQLSTLGAARFLTKPFAIEDLIEEISFVLRHGARQWADESSD